MSLVFNLNRKCLNNLCQCGIALKLDMGLIGELRDQGISGIEEKQTVKILFSGRAYECGILENGRRERRQRFG